MSYLHSKSTKLFFIKNPVTQYKDKKEPCVTAYHDYVKSKIWFIKPTSKPADYSFFNKVFKKEVSKLSDSNYYIKLKKKYTDEEIAESFILPHNLTPKQKKKEDDMFIKHRKEMMENEQVNHPSHYGGKDNPYEAIKVIEAWGANFCIGNCLKYLSRIGKKDPSKILEDYKKALWYLQREISNIEKQNKQ